MASSRDLSDPVVVVDTSIASIWFKKRQPLAERYLALVGGLTPALPAIAKAELLYGAFHGRWSANSIMALRVYIDEFQLLPIDENTLEVWAMLRNECRRFGIGNSENDAWIAATALAFDGVLVTHDRDHLRMQAAVPQLRVLSLLS